MELKYGDRAAREVSGRIAQPAASTTAIKAIPADRRIDGMICVDVTTYTPWVFEGASSAGASSVVLVPDAGSGRWHAAGLTSDVVVVSKTVGFAALTDADHQQTVDFDAALPAGAMVLAAGADVTAIFDNAGDTASLTFDLGIKNGDTDGFIDGGSLDAVAKVSVPRGVAIPGLVGAITPSIIIDADVNLNTLTKGSATFYVLYKVGF